MKLNSCLQLLQDLDRYAAKETSFPQAVLCKKDMGKICCCGQCNLEASINRGLVLISAEENDNVEVFKHVSKPLSALVNFIPIGLKAGFTILLFTLTVSSQSPGNQQLLFTENVQLSDSGTAISESQNISIEQIVQFIPLAETPIAPVAKTIPVAPVLKVPPPAPVVPAPRAPMYLPIYIR